MGQDRRGPDTGWRQTPARTRAGRLTDYGESNRVRVRRAHWRSEAGQAGETGAEDRSVPEAAPATTGRRPRDLEREEKNRQQPAHRNRAQCLSIAETQNCACSLYLSVFNSNVCVLRTSTEAGMAGRRRGAVQRRARGWRPRRRTHPAEPRPRQGPTLHLQGPPETQGMDGAAESTTRASGQSDGLQGGPNGADPKTGQRTRSAAPAQLEQQSQPCRAKHPALGPAKPRCKRDRFGPGRASLGDSSAHQAGGNGPPRQRWKLVKGKRTPERGKDRVQEPAANRRQQRQ